MKKKLIYIATIILVLFNMFPTTVYAVNQKCVEPGCNNPAYSKGIYCYYHSGTCAESGCNSRKYCGFYCAKHDKCKIKSSCKTANYGGRKICNKEHCGNTAGDDGYCSRHSKNYDKNKCCAKSCNSKKTKGSYCDYHYKTLIQSKYSSGSSSTKKKTSSSTTKKKYSMPDCDDYEDYDNFMDEWDGCMPDGSDAEDYWENW